MKRLFPILIFLFSISASAQDEIPNRPSPPRLVNDFTKDKFLTTEQAVALEQKLVAYDDSTSNQIAIVIVDDLKGYSAADYAIALGRKWGVGNKNFDNGVVLLVSTGGGEGNRAVFIAPGYGLEGAVTDLIADAIVDHELVPNFKAGNYYRGLDEATDAIIRAAEGRYKAPEGYGKKKGKGIGIGAIIFFIIMIFIFFSGMGGGRGGGMVSRRGYGDVGAAWIIGSLLGGAGRGGGGWSGGGGSGGGGGFGGFGGGGFGGGGAGGSW
ncbi:MAG: TPM domain-containing protein [Gloeobacteraceae cyanobacterium ES-bin-316]|nr:TPM domain-containing protein [Ferruginibacter sp.]